MKVIEANGFNPEFPESFSWGHLDSPILSSLASIIVAEIEHSFRTDPNRNVVPGCRVALRHLARLADL
jgi:hypothetical protein